MNRPWTEPNATCIEEQPMTQGFADFTRHSLMAEGRRFVLRRAERGDLQRLIVLLHDDVLGATREGISDDNSTDFDAYMQAFDLIAADANQLLLSVVEDSPKPTPGNAAADDAEAIVGTLQLSLVPSLSRRGTIRLQIEAVRIGRAIQGLGLGTAVFEWAHELGRTHGAGLAQLTTDKSRGDAQRFYARLGYTASHEGLKLAL